MFAADWPPAEAYPAIVTENASSTTYTFPDLAGARVTVPHGPHSGGDVYQALGGLLRLRRVRREIFPYPSKLDSLSGKVVMIPTTGWDLIPKDEVENDG